jgi:hypothetical protein
MFQTYCKQKNKLMGFNPKIQALKVVYQTTQMLKHY